MSRKKILSEDQQSALQQWVDENKAALGLYHWEIKIERKRCDKENFADTWSRIQGNHARIAVSPEFLKMSPKGRRKTMVHELLHPATRDLHQFIQDAIDHSTQHHYQTVYERTVDALAMALAPNFPEVEV